MYHGNQFWKIQFWKKLLYIKKIIILDVFCYMFYKFLLMYLRQQRFAVLKWNTVRPLKRSVIDIYTCWLQVRTLISEALTSLLLYEDCSIETRLICAAVTSSLWQRNSFVYIVCLSTSDACVKNICSLLSSKRCDWVEK